MMKNSLRLVMAACAVLWIWPAGAGAEIKLTVAESYPSNYPTTQGLLRFAELVKERSNGEIVIDVKFGGALGRNEKKLIEQIQLGALDMGRFPASALAAAMPALETLSLPYLWKSQESLWNVLRGATGQKLLKDLEAAKFYGLCYYETGARSFYNAKREIKTLADLKGLNFQTPKNPLMIDFIALLGANPVPMAFSEVYDGIRKGVVDGAENTWSVYESSGHYEIAKYYTFDRHTRIPEMLVASKIAFDKKLKPEQILLLKQAAQESQDLVIRKWNERQEISTTIVSGKGNVLNELTPAAHEEFFEASQPLYDKYAAPYKALIQEIRAQQ